MVLQVAVQVAQLLVSLHLMSEHLLLLALVFELSKHFEGQLNVLEVHENNAVRLHGPVEAIKLTHLLLFEQGAQLFHDYVDCLLFEFPGRVLIRDQVCSFNIASVIVCAQPHHVHHTMPLLELSIFELVDLALQGEVKISQVVHNFLLQLGDAVRGNREVRDSVTPCSQFKYNAVVRDREDYLSIRCLVFNFLESLSFLSVHCDGQFCGAYSSSAPSCPLL